VSGRPILAALASAALVVGACGPQEVLVAKSAAVPAGVDLSGRWRLQDESGLETLEREERKAAGNIPIPPTSNSPQAQPRPKRGSLVHIFLETGTTLKITQTDFGLFISFDRAVVEEYRYGENRVVNVGPVEAARVSGWERGGYVIETLDDDGNKLIEYYRLDDGGAELVREIEIIRRGKPAHSIVQRYERT
jgi:hypothetical protein